MTELYWASELPTKANWYFWKKSPSARPDMMLVYIHLASHELRARLIDHPVDNMTGRDEHTCIDRPLDWFSFGHFQGPLIPSIYTVVRDVNAVHGPSAPDLVEGLDARPCDGHETT